MRVLIFSTAYLPLIGGAEIAVKELTDRLGDEIEFDLITARIKSDLSKIERVGKVTVYRIGIGVEALDKLLVPFLGAIKAIRLNRAKNYSYFWCVMASFASGAAYIANWFQPRRSERSGSRLSTSGKKVPIILTLQEGDSENWLRYRWLGLIDLSWRLALARASILTAISSHLSERARRLGYKGPSFVIPNGVDLDRFKIKDSGFRNNLITVSRLVEKNGVEDIIHSLKYLPDNVTLTIIGAGPLESKLKLETRSLKLENRVEFLGKIPNSDISIYLNQADIFVRPSLSEGQGISFIEAMAAGLPVIATPVGGIPDFLKHEVTGLFVEPKNSQSIANAVTRLINDEPLRKKIIENSIKMVREKYDWNLIAKDMKNLVFKAFLPHAIDKKT